jgi:hypothetical protein
VTARQAVSTMRVRVVRRNAGGLLDASVRLPCGTRTPAPPDGP